MEVDVGVERLQSRSDIRARDEVERRKVLKEKDEDRRSDESVISQNLTPAFKPRSAILWFRKVSFKLLIVNWQGLPSIPRPLYGIGVNPY
jgi:hypothetical protein